MATYLMSDIHGYYDALRDRLEEINLTGDNKLILLGDYIDYGEDSFRVLQCLYDLQKKHGAEKVITLKGNHEQMFLEWLDTYKGSVDEFEFNDWLRTDYRAHFITLRSFLAEEQMEKISEIYDDNEFEPATRLAVKILMENHGELIKWMQKMPLFFETENQIFVHAGVDEEAEEDWKWGTSEDILLGKFPATFGKFYKTIVAGHTGTSGLAKDKSFHDAYFDGASHYYIDGSVYKGGKLLLLAFDENENRYYQVEDGKNILIRKYFR